MKDDLIFREVDEELRQDRLLALWLRYRLYIILLVVLMVSGAGAHSSWQLYRDSKIEESGVQFNRALIFLQNGQMQEASSILESLAATAYGGYPAFARLLQARILAKQGNNAAAIEICNALLAEGGNVSFLGLVNLEAVRISFPEETVTSVTQKLTSLTDDMSPWRHAARELVGLVAYRDKEMALAGKVFRKIALDPSATQELRQRAMVMLAILGQNEMVVKETEIVR